MDYKAFTILAHVGQHGWTSGMKTWCICTHLGLVGMMLKYDGNAHHRYTTNSHENGRTNYDYTLMQFGPHGNKYMLLMS